MIPVSRNWTENLCEFQNSKGSRVDATMLWVVFYIPKVGSVPTRTCAGLCINAVFIDFSSSWTCPSIERFRKRKKKISNWPLCCTLWYVRIQWAKLHILPRSPTACPLIFLMFIKHSVMGRSSKLKLWIPKNQGYKLQTRIGCKLIWTSC